MKRIFAIALVAVVVILSTTESHAVTRYTYNPGGHKDDPTTIVKQGYTGSISQPIQSTTQYTVVFDGGCIQILKVTTPVSRTTTYQWGEVIETVDTYGVPTTEVLVEFCP